MTLNFSDKNVYYYRQTSCCQKNKVFDELHVKKTENVLGFLVDEQYFLFKFKNVFAILNSF